MEDREIVALYWERDPRAVSESQDKYGSFCGQLARNILEIREDAEECVNDTWLRVWNTVPPKKPDSLQAYLGRIVRNLALDRWRHLHAQKRYAGTTVLLDELEECIPDGRHMEQTFEDREITRTIERWLRGLDRQDRVLFLKRYWYGVRLDELAEQAGCAPGQLARRMLRLRRQLRRTLEREGIWL